MIGARLPKRRENGNSLIKWTTSIARSVTGSWEGKKSTKRGKWFFQGGNNQGGEKTSH